MILMAAPVWGLENSPVFTPVAVEAAATPTLTPAPTNRNQTTPFPITGGVEYFGSKGPVNAQHPLIVFLYDNYELKGTPVACACVTVNGGSYTLYAPAAGSYYPCAAYDYTGMSLDGKTKGDPFTIFNRLCKTPAMGIALRGPIDGPRFAFGDICISGETPTPTFTPPPTATPYPAFNISGTVTYQGTGTHNLYVFMTDNNGGYYLSPPLPNKGFYSFIESPSASHGFTLWVCYDFTGNGMQLTPNYGGYGYPVQQGTGASISGSGDVICNVGFFGDCANLGPGNGTFYTSDSTVNITFGGGSGPQSGTSCK